MLPARALLWTVKYADRNVQKYLATQKVKGTYFCFEFSKNKKNNGYVRKFLYKINFITFKNKKMF